MEKSSLEFQKKMLQARLKKLESYLLWVGLGSCYNPRELEKNRKARLETVMALKEIEGELFYWQGRLGGIK